MGFAPEKDTAIGESNKQLNGDSHIDKSYAFNSAPLFWE
jgi:hypothetical protein